MSSAHIAACAFAASVLAISGCTQHTSISGEGVVHAQLIHGNVGITGDDHELTILSGSDVPILSIIGDDVEVTIEDGARVHKIEIVGDDNLVVCPQNASVCFASIGDNNKIRYRHRSE